MSQKLKAVKACGDEMLTHTHVLTCGDTCPASWFSVGVDIAGLLKFIE